MKSDVYHIDIETWSERDIRKTGHFKYAEACEILILAIARNEGDVETWQYGQDPNCPAIVSLKHAIMSEATCYAHNAAFEFAVFMNQLELQFGIKPPALEQWRCTQAMCRLAAVPSSLMNASIFLKLGDDSKDKEGKRLIKKFSCPRRQTKHDKRTRVMPDDDPDDFDNYVEYCRQDVIAERAIHRKLNKFRMNGRWNLESFHQDMRMNLLGIPVNLDALRHTQKLLEEYKGHIEEEFYELTSAAEGESGMITLPKKTNVRDAPLEVGAVYGFKPSQWEMCFEWFKSHGYGGEGLSAADIEPWLTDRRLTKRIRRALLVYSRQSFAAVKKVKAMIDMACDDGRIRGALLWAGAERTHRWAGQKIQPQNFARPTINGTRAAYDALCDGAGIDEIEAIYGDFYEVVASCIRHFIQPPHGTVLQADYSAIEARIAPWLCKQQSTLDLFASGAKIYEMMASVIFGVPPDKVSKDQRFVGKQAVLGCIAKGQLVLTDRGLVPIEEIKYWHLLWDGVEWVRHDGLIEKGVKEVITYQGLTATPDHKVWVEGQSNSIQIREAASSLHRLQDSGRGWAPIRVDHSDTPRKDSCEGVCPCQGSLQVRPGEVVALEKPSEREKHTVACDRIEVETFDILNAGPRHRFTVSGKLVSNCGFNMGPAKFRGTCESYGFEPTPEMVEAYKPRHKRIITNAVHTVKQKIARDCAAKKMDIPEGLDYDLRTAKAKGWDTLGCSIWEPETDEQWAHFAYDELAARAVRTWRKTNPKMVECWKALDDGAKDAILHPGKIIEVGLLKLGVIKNLGLPGKTLCIRLPSGHSLTYPMASVVKDTKKGWGTHIRFWGIVPNSGGRWGWCSTYGGKLLENCLARGTKVVTSKGPKNIEEITSQDFIWDGEEYVKSDGAIYKSVADCITVGGVTATPDHKFMVDNHWFPIQTLTHAEITSPWDRPDGAENRSSESGLNCTSGAQDDVECGMQVWEEKGDGRGRTAKGGAEGEDDNLLPLMPPQYKPKTKDPRPMQGQAICDPQVTAGAVQQPEPQGLPQLRGTWDQSLSGMGELYNLLLGHDPNLRGGIRHRPQGQRGGLLKGKLSVGNAKSELPKQEGEFDDRHPLGPDHCCGSVRIVGGQIHNPPLPDCPQCPDVGNVPPRQSRQQVYDILNCGPRNRFAVVAKGGIAIAHNCTQGTAGDISREGNLVAEEAGYLPFMVVHDELLCEKQPGQTHQELCNLICTMPKWAEGLPLAAEGNELNYYEKT